LHTATIFVVSKAGTPNGVGPGYSGRAISRGVRFFHGPRADPSAPSSGIELDELGVAVGHHGEGEPRRTARNIQIHHAAIVGTNRIGPGEGLSGPTATYGVGVQF